MRASVLLLCFCLSCATTERVQSEGPSRPKQLDRAQEVFGLAPDSAPADVAGELCRQAAGEANQGRLDASRARLLEALRQDWAGTAALFREGASCMAWLASSASEGWFQVELRRIGARLRRPLLFGMPVVRKWQGSVRAGAYQLESERFVPAHPHVEDSIAAFFAQNAERALVITGRLEGGAADNAFELSDFGFRIYETQRAGSIAARASMPWDGRLRIAIGDERTLFIASRRDYPWFELKRGWVSESAYQQFKSGIVFGEGGVARVATADGGSQIAPSEYPTGTILELTAEGLALERESSSFFIVDGPTLDIGGKTLALGEAKEGLEHFVVARSNDRQRTALTLFFERCDGRGLAHRVVELTGEASAPIARVLADGKGLGLGLYDLDNNLFVQSGERLQVHSPDGNARQLSPGLLLLPTLAPLECGESAASQTVGSANTGP